MAHCVIVLARDDERMMVVVVDVDVDWCDSDDTDPGPMQLERYSGCWPAMMECIATITDVLPLSQLGKG